MMMTPLKGFKSYKVRFRLVLLNMSPYVTLFKKQKLVKNYYLGLNKDKEKQ